MTIFDIGANIGNFTDRCLQEKELNQIILVEANPQLSNYLNEKYKAENKVIVLNNAVSEKSGEDLDFYISNANAISTASTDWITKSRFANQYRWNSAIKVKTINIDELIEKYGNPDLIKVDVEGYEYEVFKGLSSKQNKICFEWAEEEYEKLNLIVEKLKTLGYTEFGFTYGDEPLNEPSEYTEWEKCKIHQDININRKDRWGMVWTK